MARPPRASLGAHNGASKRHNEGTLVAERLEERDRVRLAVHDDDAPRRALSRVLIIGVQEGGHLGGQRDGARPAPVDERRARARMQRHRADGRHHPAGLRNLGRPSPMVGPKRLRLRVHVQDHRTGRRVVGAAFVIEPERRDGLPAHVGAAGQLKLAQVLVQCRGLVSEASDLTELVSAPVVERAPSRPPNDDGQEDERRVLAKAHRIGFGGDPHPTEILLLPVLLDRIEPRAQLRHRPRPRLVVGRQKSAALIAVRGVVDDRPFGLWQLL